MVQLGYTLSSEEFRPRELAEQAKRAEEVGFTYALISDHFHPWLDSQGHSPFAWITLGAVALATERLTLGTGVTCPLIRYAPVIIAQAAATVADLLPGRFFLGVGTGEYLNEHITGEHWPPISLRQEMLIEAVVLIRELWDGGYTTHYGEFFTVENARIYTLPETLPSIYVAASGTESAQIAGAIGDGLISTAPDAETVKTFDQAGGTGKPKYGQMTVCWGEDENRAKHTATEIWGYTALPGQLSQELALPAYFEQATQLVTPEQATKHIVCGPDTEKYLEQIKTYADAGFTHVYLHQIGPDQEGFLKFAQRELLPKFQ
ncbi:MAG: TIGR03557 family F420-dependent LLM class oxidoreductase [Thermomicrobiales bacterium]